MTDSKQLLANYAENGSEGAFRELVARYINLVYSTALRLVDGNSQLAEDVSQTVFINLATKAGTLSPDVMLGGWLHQHTFHVATKTMRGEWRRQAREREAAEMNMLQDDSNWRQLGPVIDEAITELPAEDRTAILLRFFEQLDFRSVGKALGSSEDAARMRVSRALEKLQFLLKRRGVALSATTVGSALTAQAITAAPAGLALAVSGAAIAKAAAAGGTAVGFLKLMATTKLKLGLTTLIVAGGAVTLLVQHQTQGSLREQNEALREQVAALQRQNESLSNRVAKAARAPRLPAPPLPAPSTRPAAAEPLPSSNLYGLLTNGPAKLTTAQLESYLKANKRNAASLLAAFRTTGDLSLLQEAMQNFPNDPHVAFEAALRKNATAAERRQWLDTFKQTAPENALANYLSASEHFKSGQTDAAVRDLLAAAGKAEFQDYSMERIEDDDEAFRTAGYSVAQAKIAASAGLLLPQLIQVRDLSQHIVDLASSYRKSGDEASAQAALQMAIDLGQRFTSSAPGQILIGEMVGVAVERKALQALDPNATLANGQTVQDRLNQLGQHRDSIRQLSQQAAPLYPGLSEQDWITYQSRSMAFGEQAALRWLISKHGQK